VFFLPAFIVIIILILSPSHAMLSLAMQLHKSHSSAITVDRNMCQRRLASARYATAAGFTGYATAAAAASANSYAFSTAGCNPTTDKRRRK
jgi:hypothetical protein